MSIRNVGAIAVCMSLIPMSIVGQVPIPEGTQLAEDFFRLDARLWALEQLMVAALACFVLASGFGARIASKIEAYTKGRLNVSIAVFAILYAGLYSAVKLPIDYWQMVKLNPYWGVPVAGLVEWTLQQIVPVGRLLILAAIGGWLLLWLIRKCPKTWWLWTTASVVVFLTADLTFEPALNYSDSERYVSIESTEFAEWEPRFDALVSRVRVRDSDIPIEVWRTTEQDFCREINSVVGLGPTRKIILADQIFSEWEPGEIEAAFAHELKHYLLDNTWVPIAIISVIAISGGLFVFVLGNYACRRWHKNLGFASLSNSAAIPLLVLLLQVFILLATPAFNLTAQPIELAADRFALELTRDNDARARISADQCGRLWLPEDTLYARLYVNTHPSIGKRVRLANEYRPWETGEPLAYEELIDFPD
jgi:STE24 endopeptidase